MCNKKFFCWLFDLVDLRPLPFFFKYEALYFEDFKSWTFRVWSIPNYFALKIETSTKYVWNLKENTFWEAEAQKFVITRIL